MKNKIGPLFILVAVLCLLGGVFFGTISSVQFIYPKFLDELPFFKTRPFHVSIVVGWIFMSAAGGIYYYLPRFTGLTWHSAKLPFLHLFLFIFSGLAILTCFAIGKFGGREYWEFPSWLGIFIVVTWLAFGYNFFKTVFRKNGRWPVYLWMWATGILFFLFTFIESYLWIFPYFRDNLPRDLTMQWKAYGALVGSWNMLVYGTAIFLVERISGDEKVAHSKLAFSMYFLGLTNLMFGWAHHIYIVPSAPWIRYFAYAISMTELIILARIIYSAGRSLSEARKSLHVFPFRFLFASDVWVFLNLALALAISVPAINIFTHGTHVTVAHAMGSTIGINTMILLASCFFILSDFSKDNEKPMSRIIRTGFWITNISLLFFWLALITAGLVKGTAVIYEDLTFREIMEKIHPYLVMFIISGAGIFSGILMICLPFMYRLSGALTKK